jgi:hypothetical protein
MSRLARWRLNWRALAPAERRVLLAASLLMPVFALGLRVLGLRRCRALLKPDVLAQTRSELPSPRVLGQLVNLAARRSPLHASCLTRSLMLTWMLRRRGIASDLRIGVRLEGGRLDAHAWVETDGTPINDDLNIASRFAPLQPQVNVPDGRFS